MVRMERFHRNLRGSSFTLKVVQLWNKLLEKVVEAEQHLREIGARA